MERFRASMLLSGVGDALGYRNGMFEFNESGPAIHEVNLFACLSEPFVFPDQTIASICRKCKGSEVLLKSTLMVSKPSR